MMLKSEMEASKKFFYQVQKRKQHMRQVRRLTFNVKCKATFLQNAYFY